ncbi:hypothetical protein BJY52DRAFT_622458 [Lactarius psammicola]|nr:hypothetical protein BJY52DRAFT_622458 [Lactarius psammicola]
MSLISTEPQSRAALEGHSNSLISQFDTQLEIIVDRYLSFFQERRSIEETYVDSLRNLHLKAYVTDTSFDPRVEPTTTRAAWNKVRGNLERESKARQAFVNTLDVDVLKPLTTLKESLAQTRMRLSEELKKSAEDYANHAENTLSKLGRVYLKRYQDYVRPVEIPRRTPDISNKSIGSRFSSLFRGRRETEGTESDVAEPEEVVSDDDCRKAVHFLNVLRLRRAEILEDGYESLERLVLTTTIKDTLVKYVDGMISSCGKHTYLAINTRSEVGKALASPDTHDLAASFRRSLAFSTPPVTFYRNFRVGGYSDAIFGVTLADYASSRDREDIVPKIIRVCTEEVEKRGLSANKIYSSGSIDSAEVQKLRHRFEQNEKSFSFSSMDDIHSIAMLLKLYLRELPEPLFRLSLHDYRQYGQNKASFTENDFSLLRSRIHELPAVHKASLGALSQHLSLVASHADRNGMSPHDLASALALHVFGKGEVLQGNVDVKKLARASTMEVLIRNAQALFHEYPLPPTPPSSAQTEETTSIISYGSLFLSPEFPQYPEVQPMIPVLRPRPRPVSQIHTSSQSTSSVSPSNSTADLSRCLTPTLVPLLSPLPSFSRSRSSPETKETPTREQVRHNTRSREAMFPNSSQDAVPPPPQSTVSRRPPQQQPYLEALSLSLSPGAGSLLSDITDNPLSSATSLRSAMGAYSPPPEERLR